MADCTVASASANNRAIRPDYRIAWAFCKPSLHLNHVRQSSERAYGKDAAASLLEASSTLADAACGELFVSSGWRICALCNERTFADAHDRTDGNCSAPCPTSESTS